MNRDTLLADLLKYYHHDKVTDNFDSLLRYAEGKIKLTVQTSLIELSEYGTVDKPYIELPDDLLVIQRLIIYRGSEELSQPQAAAGAFEDRTKEPGIPRSYNRLDQVLMLYPTPSQAYEYTLYYIPEARPLDFNNPTNSILEKAPQIYLYACLEQAALMLEDFERSGYYAMKYNEAVAELDSASIRKKYSLDTPIRPRFRASA